MDEFAGNQKIGEKREATVPLYCRASPIIQPYGTTTVNDRLNRKIAYAHDHVQEGGVWGRSPLVDEEAFSPKSWDLLLDSLSCFTLGAQKAKNLGLITGSSENE